MDEETEEVGSPLNNLTDGNAEFKWTFGTIKKDNRTSGTKCLWEKYIIAEHRIRVGATYESYVGLRCPNSTSRPQMTPFFLKPMSSEKPPAHNSGGAYLDSVAPLFWADLASKCGLSL